VSIFLPTHWGRFKRYLIEIKVNKLVKILKYLIKLSNKRTAFLKINNWEEDIRKKRACA
jgi:hypothetical protein